MTLPDPVATAALGDDVIKPVFFVYLDILTDPVLANSSGVDMTPSGSGDPDLDGKLFTGISHQFVNISPVRVESGGSQPVTAQLSGLPVIDADTLNLLGDRKNWQSRKARLWRVIRDAENTQQGGFQPYYTGYMTALDIDGEPGSQIITVTIETYLAAFSRASGRTYLDQERYDPGDLSARAASSMANGVSGAVGNTPRSVGGVVRDVIERSMPGLSHR